MKQSKLNNLEKQQKRMIDNTMQSIDEMFEQISRDLKNQSS